MPNKVVTGRIWDLDSERFLIINFIRNGTMNFGPLLHGRASLHVRSTQSRTARDHWKASILSQVHPHMMAVCILLWDEVDISCKPKRVKLYELPFKHQMAPHGAQNSKVNQSYQTTRRRYRDSILYRLYILFRLYLRSCCLARISSKSCQMSWRKLWSLHLWALSNWSSSLNPQ